MKSKLFNVLSWQKSFPYRLFQGISHFDYHMMTSKYCMNHIEVLMTRTTKACTTLAANDPKLPALRVQRQLIASDASPFAIKHFSLSPKNGFFLFAFVINKS